MSWAPQFLQDWVRDNAVRNRQEDIHTPGEYNATAWDNFVGGVVGVDTEGAVDKHTQTVKNQAVDEVLTAGGETRESLGLGPNATRGEATAAIVQAGRTRQAEEKKTDFQNTMTATMAPLTAQLASQNNQFNATMQRTLAQDARNYQLQLQTAADNKEARADELEYQRMRDRKADQQYNERMEQLDRKDRRQALSSLAGGLAALGAAFAL